MPNQKLPGHWSKPVHYSHYLPTYLARKAKMGADSLVRSPAVQRARTPRQREKGGLRGLSGRDGKKERKKERKTNPPGSSGSPALGTRRSSIARSCLLPEFLPCPASSALASPPKGELAVGYRWTGWIWEITGWSWRLQENYRPF